MSTTFNSSWVLLATLLRPQGRKGEILAESFTDFPESLAGRAGLYLAPADFAEGEADANPCTVLTAWLPKGRNEGRVVLALGGVSSIDEAQALCGLELVVRAEHRQLLDDGAAYISDLVGSTVFDGDQPIGPVRDVQFPTTADGRRRLENVAPLLVVVSGADELLVPFVREQVDRIDTAAKELHLRLPVGLLDLQRPGS